MYVRSAFAAIFAASTYLLALSAAAQPSRLETFADYDPAGVGKVSLDTWKAHDWSDALLKYDADRDGHIKQAEYVSKFCKQVQSGLKRAVPRCLRDAALLFAILDRDHNGELSRAEIGAQSERLFHQNDRNHDGFVTAQEMRETMSGR